VQDAKDSGFIAFLRFASVLGLTPRAGFGFSRFFLARDNWLKSFSARYFPGKLKMINR